MPVHTLYRVHGPFGVCTGGRDVHNHRRRPEHGPPSDPVYNQPLRLNNAQSSVAAANISTIEKG